MTRPDWANYAFRYFATADDLSPHRGRADKQRRYEGFSQFELGMLREARLVAALGQRAGYFSRNRVESWLADTDDRSTTHSDLTEQAEADGAIPGHVGATDLLALADEGPREFDPNSFQTGLLFRHALTYGDDEAFTFRRFQALLLFSTDENWQGIVDTTRAEIVARDPFSLERFQGESLFVIEGACRLPTACADLVSQVGGRGPIEGSVWPELGGGPILLDRESARLRKQASEIPQLLVEAMRLLNSSHFTRRRSASSVLQLLWAARLSWFAAQTALDAESRPYSAFPGEDLIFDRAATLDDATDCLRVGLATPWPCMLWRIAPSDARSRRRFREAVDLVRRYLARLASAARENPPLGVAGWSPER